MKNYIMPLFASLSIILASGCVDKDMEARIEYLNREVAALKLDSKTADDILILKNEYRY